MRYGYTNKYFLDMSSMSGLKLVDATVHFHYWKYYHSSQIISVNFLKM